MREELEKLVAAGKITRQQVEPLLQLTKTGYCHHRSWGFGRILSIDTVFARCLIDFQNKPGHAMDLRFAADSLKAISPDHILARKATDLEGLRQLAALNHLEVIKLVLESHGGRCSAEQIQQILVPDVIQDDWKKWWEVAKRELKKSGHFQVPIKKTDPILYTAKEVTLDERLLADFRQAKGLKAKVNAASEVQKAFPDLRDGKTMAAEVVKSLGADIVSHQRTFPGLALEAIFLRDDLRQLAESPAVAGELTASDIWHQESIKFSGMLESLPAPKHKRAILTFKDANPQWEEAVLDALNSLSAKSIHECVQVLVQEGKLNSLKTVLARLISQHTASSELLLWLAKERSDTYADILGPEVFRAMLTTMERDQFNEKRSHRLADFILNDQALLVELIGSADFDVIKDLTRALQLSPVFDDMDKRSLLARIVKAYPAVQTLISGEQSRQEAPMWVSWGSLMRRKNEYHELVEKKIPANSKEIAIARSYGDLRENHEYKAAKEMQKILLRRKSELELQLVHARGTDFANPRTEVVSLGTQVRVIDVTTNQTEKFDILGAWDSEPEKGIVSYLSPIGQALLNHKVGDEVEFENHGEHRHYRVDAIEVTNVKFSPEEGQTAPVDAAAATMAQAAPPAPPAA